MAIFYVDLTAGTGINRDSPPTGTKSKASFQYIMREGKYAKKDDLIKIENSELDKDKFPLGYDPNPNFTKLGYDPEEFWLLSEDKSVVGNEHTASKKLKIALPSELSNEDNIALAQKFCNELFGEKYLYTFVVHAPDFDNNSEKSEKWQKQTHFHVQFSLQEIPQSDYDKPVPIREFLRPYGFTHKKIDGVLTKVQFGHAKKSTYMNSQSKRINEITGKEYPKFVDMVREKWEDIINEKLIEKGIEPVSRKTLVDQRDDALLIGDLEKAESLNRPPINLPSYIKLKKNPNERDIERMKQNEINKEIKEKKLEVYAALKKDFNSERSKDIHVLWDSIDNCTSKLDKLKSDRDVQVEKNSVAVLNKVSDGLYYRIRNKLEKEKNAKKISDINEELSILKTKILADKDKSKQYHTLLKSYNSKSSSTYAKKEKELKDERKIIQDKFKTLEFYNPKTDLPGSLNHQYYKYQQQVIAYNNNPTDNAKIDVSVALNTFEDLLFKQMKEERLGNLPSELNSLKDDLVVAEHHLKTDLNVFNKPKKEYITKIASIKEDIAKKTNEISKIEKTFDSLKSTPDFKDKVTTKKEELIKTETTKVANKEKERVTNKPIPVRDYAANEVKRKKQSNSKSAGGWSHSLEPTEIEELEKDKENERG
jgi:exonuclease SbcC